MKTPWRAWVVIIGAALVVGVIVYTLPIWPK